MYPSDKLDLGIIERDPRDEGLRKTVGLLEGGLKY